MWRLGGMTVKRIFISYAYLQAYATRRQHLGIKKYLTPNRQYAMHVLKDHICDAMLSVPQHIIIDGYDS